MEENKELTKGQIRRNAKKEALKKVLAFVGENTQDSELLGCVSMLTPGRRVVQTTKKDVIAELFIEERVVHEDVLWANYKLGRADMRKVRVNLIKKAPTPEERVWIDFDPKSGEYTLVHIGQEVPQGWTGYVPMTLTELQLD